MIKSIKVLQLPRYIRRHYKLILCSERANTPLMNTICYDIQIIKFTQLTSTTLQKQVRNSANKRCYNSPVRFV